VEALQERLAQLQPILENEPLIVAVYLLGSQVDGSAGARLRSSSGLLPRGPFCMSATPRGWPISRNGRWCVTMTFSPCCRSTTESL
jgi:hypothetical protein